MSRFQWCYKVIQGSSVQVTSLEKDNLWQNAKSNDTGKSKTVAITKLHCGYSFRL